jgi:hypothetical protein
MASDIIPEQSIIRRNRPGTKGADFYNWPDQDFNDMETTLSVQQYIQQLIRKDYKDVEGILEPPQGQDEASWKYEHLRLFCSSLNLLSVCLIEECDQLVCKQMTATEQWIFLCAAHKQPRECSALDYTLHTLHGASSLLNSNKHFPSRVSIKENSAQKLSSVARRIYRIFSHAYFHHRQLFDDFEEKTYLCKRFTRYVIKYNLMTAENLIVPLSALGLKDEDEDDDNDGTAATNEQHKEEQLNIEEDS